MAGKVGSLKGPTNISCLYTTETASGDAAKLINRGAETMSVVRAANNVEVKKGYETNEVLATESVSMRSNVKPVEKTSEKAEAVSMVKATVNKASGTLNAVKADGMTDKNADGTYNVIVKITDTESVGNAKYVLRYDPAKMTYVSSTSRNYSAIHVDETKGEITLAFANPVEVAAGTAIGTVKFLAEKNVETTVTVTTEERNANTNVNEAPATVKVDTTETPEVDKPIVIIPTKPGGTPADKKLPFTDVSKYDEFYDAVKYLYERDIMNGTSDTLFSPNAELTRGMVVTVLGRAAGVKTAGYAGTSFSDVKAGSWYAPYVQWASKQGLVKGYEDGTFKPEQNVTREEMVTMLFRCWQSEGNTWKTDVTALNAYKDSAKVSSWALPAMRWAAANGVVNGVGDSMLEPQGQATRAQFAKIIMVYLENLA